MTTFAVFGMTREFAFDEAKRRVPTHDAESRPFTESEWLGKVESYVREVMDGRRVVRLSQMYDHPKPAREYFELAKRQEHRSLKVMKHVKDGTDPATGKPILVWTDA